MIFTGTDFLNNLFAGNRQRWVKCKRSPNLFISPSCCMYCIRRRQGFWPFKDHYECVHHYKLTLHLHGTNQVWKKVLHSLRGLKIPHNEPSISKLQSRYLLVFWLLTDNQRFLRIPTLPSKQVSKVVRMQNAQSIGTHKKAPKWTQAESMHKISRTQSTTEGTFEVAHSSRHFWSTTGMYFSSSLTRIKSWISIKK